MTNIWVPPRGVDVSQINSNFGGNPDPIFHSLFDDLGNGIANTIPYKSYGTVRFFARPTAGWTRLANGNWISVAAGSPRAYYGATPGTVFTGRYDGILLERSSQNNCLWSRDWTNAVWVKTNMTAVKDATGIDGVTNSATRLVALANNATISQTPGVNTNWCLCFIRRISGSGSIFLQTAAATFVDITAQVAVFGTGWSSTPIAAYTAGATVIGIKLGTSGDQIAVDMAQCEDKTAGYYTSPIPTTNAVDIRLADSLNYANFAFNKLGLTFGCIVSPYYKYDATVFDNSYPMSTTLDVTHFTGLNINFTSAAPFCVNMTRIGPSGSGALVATSSTPDLHLMNPATLIGTVGLDPKNPVLCYYNESGPKFFSPSNPPPVEAASVSSILDFTQVAGLGTTNPDSFAIKSARVYSVALDTAQIATLQQNYF